MLIKRIIILVSFICSISLLAQDSGFKGSSQKGPVTYCVFMHSPGPNWQKGLPFQKQPGVQKHVLYMRQLFDQELMVMGGPFPDDSGGMMIYRGADLEKATKLAEADPAVKSGLLRVSVKQWMVPMSSVTFISKE